MEKQALPIQGSDRFLIELEFIQNLSNPKYLNYLAQNGYLQQPEFLEFLKYLTYWKQPEYLKLLLFPQCLVFLENLIKNPTFCRELAIPQFVEYVHAQQGSHWIAKER
jgi:mediator of RNA polymerase II transcription subunit 31